MPGRSRGAISPRPISLVSRALRELKLEGSITTARGAGCFVNRLSAPVTEVVMHTGYPVRLTSRPFFAEIITG
jgi:hypothetical protein